MATSGPMKGVDEYKMEEINYLFHDLMKVVGQKLLVDEYKMKKINDLFHDLMKKVGQELLDHDQERPDQESKLSAIIANDIDHMKNLLSQLQKEIMAKAGSSWEKPLSETMVASMKKILPYLMKEVEQKLFDHDKELFDQESKSSAIISKDNIENVKNLLSQLQKILRDIASSSSTPPQNKPHQPLLLKEDKLDPILENFKVSYDNLNHQLRICLLYLSIFPEKAVIKKRPIIYWWIANGLIKTNMGEKKTVEEKGEDIFEVLVQLDLIMPSDKGKIPNVNKCRIHPWIRHMLITLARKANLFDFDSEGMLPYSNASSGHACLQQDGDLKKLVAEKTANSGRNYFKTSFNVGDKYLFLNPTWFANSKKLVALQLGRWQDSPLHHIEVERDDLLSKALGTQKFLKYLSLRGISRITKLPDSISQLINLEILDLKACHNLETVPDDIWGLKKLTHLDVSDCYLLEGMPKGLEKLSSLQALKGFIIAESKRTHTRIRDLKSLENLKRFSIHIGNEADIQEGEFEKLEELKSVQRLKISWSVVLEKKKERVMKEDFKFPTSLEKLALEGFPYERLPAWLKPSKLVKLKTLYIKGGNLNDLNHDESGNQWKVEILRLLYIKNNNKQIDISTAKLWFPNLRCEPEIKYASGR